MPGINSAEITVGANGRVLVAPLATAAPADPFAAWPAGWIDLGFLSEAGAKVHDGKTITEVKVWQSPYPARRIITARQFKLTMALVQFNKLVVPLAFGGGTVTPGVGAGAATLTNGVSTGGVATLTTTTPHGFVVGAQVTVVQTSGNTGFAGTYTITAVGSTTTFSYALATVIATGAITGTATSPAWYQFNPPGASVLDERAMGIEWTDGAKVYRLVIPKGMVTDPVDVDVARTKEVMLPLGFEATTVDSTTNPYYILTSDPAFA